MVIGFWLGWHPLSAQATDRWDQPHPAVSHLSRTTREPWQVEALIADLCAEGIEVRATASTERGRTTSSFAGRVDALLAVNGDFFGQGYTPEGLAHGHLLPWDDTADRVGKGFVGFGNDVAELSPDQEVRVGEAWMEEVVSGRPSLIEAGVPLPADTTDLCATRNPRTAAGLTADRRSLILAVVDGRSAASVGMTCTELASLMAELGAHDAVNLDGGGSTTMWLAGSGVLHQPSDGAERVVANHLAVQALGMDVEPRSCVRDLDAAALLPGGLGADPTTDLEGDGVADWCGRTSAGVECLTRALTRRVAGPALTDADGWAQRNRFATIRMGDVTGDGLSDLCARDATGVRCWPSTGDGFDPPFAGPEWSDALGWDRPERYGTLRLADIAGDGRDDLCARSASGFVCHAATGAGFGPEIPLGRMADSGAWLSPSHFGTIRMADVTGDGRMDVCARQTDQVTCWPSEGSAWGEGLPGPAWSDEAGWDALDPWSTLQTPHVDGDGKADLCGRGSAAWLCHLSTGSGFGAEIVGPPLSDDDVWDDYDNFSTLRMGDIDGDGDADLCGRTNGSYRCHPYAGGGFGEVIAGPDLPNQDGWNLFRTYSTLALADVDGDSRSDVCGRGRDGARCWLSDGLGFPRVVFQEGRSDAAGWGDPSWFSTLRLAEPVVRPESPGQHSAVVGPSTAGHAPHSAGPSPGDPETGNVSETAPEVAPRSPTGCGCRSREGPSRLGLALLAIVATGRRRRRDTGGGGSPTRPGSGPSAHAWRRPAGSSRR